MAHIGDDKGDRDTTVDLNLVPIIDLMSVCIIFLLITAVWTQVSMIQIGSSLHSKKAEEKPYEPPKEIDEVAFRLDVMKTGYRVIIGRQSMSFPRKNGELDNETLTTELKKIKELYPKKESCTITVQEELPYHSLISGMDALLVAGFPNIEVATGGAAP